MNVEIALAKIAQVNAGSTAIMSDAELDWLIDNGHHPSDVVSIHNPDRVGTLDVYLVAQLGHPVMHAERTKTATLTSLTRAMTYEAPTAWDEPAGASSARGWYWPKASTTPGQTLCAGHYLDYGPNYRHDDRQAMEPGTIHCVVLAKATGRCSASKYVETVEAARAFIETEAAKVGHPRS